jgi:hypothetical protein
MAQGNEGLIELMDPNSNSLWCTPVSKRNRRMLEWKDTHLNSHWPTLLSQGNGWLLEWRALNSNGSGPSTVWKKITIQLFKQPGSKCDDHAKTPHINSRILTVPWSATQATRRYRPKMGKYSKRKETRSDDTRKGRNLVSTGKCVSPGTPQRARICEDRWNP